MTREEKIIKLEGLINEYNRAQEKLFVMRTMWDDNDDSFSDSGLQYEQEQECEERYNRIVEYAKREL